MKKLTRLLLLLPIVSCASLHHYQLSDIDNRTGEVQIPFDIKLNEIGVDTKQLGQNIDFLSGNKERTGERLGNFIQMFQMGPRTGLPVYSTSWLNNLLSKIYITCPSGKITGLASIRENQNYGGISGEYVKITGICLKPKS